MINKIEKPKIPKNAAYVLSSSQLDKLFSDAGVSVCTHLVYWYPQKLGSILEAHYWMPNGNAPYPKLYVRAGAVEKSDAEKARDLMKKCVLPEFLQWLETILNLPVDSPKLYKTPYFNAIYVNNEIMIQIET